MKVIFQYFKIFLNWGKLKLVLLKLVEKNSFLYCGITKRCHYVKIEKVVYVRIFKICNFSIANLSYVKVQRIYECTWLHPSSIVLRGSVTHFYTIERSEQVQQPRRHILRFHSQWQNRMKVITIAFSSITDKFPRDKMQIFYFK